MPASKTYRFAIASLLIMTMASCTLIKPIACAAVFPIHQFQKSQTVIQIVNTPSCRPPA
tara:strand:- start:47782 stop:47958 length:177 start_codon:yes stop_codon:yes gene_type:complete